VIRLWKKVLIDKFILIFMKIKELCEMKDIGQNMVPDFVCVNMNQ
jgi:hypothetical protein